MAGAYNAEFGTPPYQTANVRASDAQIAEANASPNDSDLHGSHVAGLAGAATHNGSGVSGAGFDSALLPVKVTLTVPDTPQGDATYVANVVDGIMWATNAGARVMNMSFGSGAYHQALADAVAYAASRGSSPSGPSTRPGRSRPSRPTAPTSTSPRPGSASCPPGTRGRRGSSCRAAGGSPDTSRSAGPRWPRPSWPASPA